ncbi:uncharacterized protein LOC126321776 [Schistocerca gregaria]|uniref:uncharacterized protein LOC126321776 n=1 Tax=Schistocerca gregaria TaxID=7010 RepID=UPI00211DBCFA|nr:uncharacterized protein LOC126321776 [Schistocerca gregaria]
MKVGHAFPKEEGRDKHGTHPHKFQDEAVKGVRDFIHAISKYNSHYSRQQNLNKVHFGCDLTIAFLFRDKYSEYCKEKGVPTVPQSKFRAIFVSEFNIGFKLSKSSTCSTCDAFLMVTGNSGLFAEEITHRKKQRELHLRNADSGQNMIVSLSSLAKENLKEHHIIAIDMQQTFPALELTAGPAFYMREI